MKFRKKDRIKEVFDEYSFMKSKQYNDTAKQIYAYAYKRWGKAWLQYIRENGK